MGIDEIFQSLLLDENSYFLHVDIYGSLGGRSYLMGQGCYWDDGNVWKKSEVVVAQTGYMC